MSTETSATIYLHGLRVMVTRPKPAGSELCQVIERAGGETTYFPTIDILPPLDLTFFERQIAKLDRQDWLIFISPQAVYKSSAAIHARWPHFPPHVKVAAVGAGTAKALLAAGLPVDVYPEERWSSEGLLDLPTFHEPTGVKIILFRGEGGREWLADTLRARGALVTSAIAYRRCLPVAGIDEAKRLLQQHLIDVATTASADGLRNLKELLWQAWPDLQILPIVVISQPMLVLAEELGFQKILLARNASHSAIIDCLNEYNSHK